MSPAMPSSPVAMSANDAGSGFEAMLLAAAAAFAADDPEPSEPGVAPLEEPPFTSSATGVESSLKALPAGGDVPTSVEVFAEVFAGGEEIADGSLGFAEAGGLDAADRAEAEASTRALSSAPL
jgi:hypothetical protein